MRSLFPFSLVYKFTAAHPVRVYVYIALLVCSRCIVCTTSVFEFTVLSRAKLDFVLVLIDVPLIAVVEQASSIYRPGVM